MRSLVALGVALALWGCQGLDPGQQGAQVGPVLALAVSPPTAERGATVTLAVETTQDFFNPQSTLTVSGTGVTVEALILGDQRHAAAVVAVASSAPVGSRTVTARSGGRTATGSLTIVTLSQAPRVVAIEPAAAPAGETLEVTVRCANTSFRAHSPPTLVLYAPTSATLTGVEVLSAVLVRGTLAVPAIPAGPRPLFVIDGSTHIARPFLVGRANSGSAVLDPPAAGQGERLPVQVIGTNTHFDVGELQVTVPHGSGLQVLGTTVLKATRARLDLRIAANAAVGPTTIYLVNDLYVVAAAFEVWPAPEIALTPAEAVEGRSLTVAVAGTDTHFLDGVTTATSDGTEAQIDAFRVLGPAAAEVDLTLPLNWLPAPVARTLTITTRWEIAAATFTVQPAARFTLAPAELHQGAAEQLVATGQFTHFEEGVTQAVLPLNAGFSVTGVTVTSPTEALLDVVVDLAAEVGPRTFELVTGDERAVGTLGIFSLCAGVVCTALDECHEVGVCDPMTGLCSNPTKAPDTPCTEDGNPCTRDVCDGAGACSHPAGNAGAPCRPSAGDCDLPEFCDGLSPACPADAKVSSLVLCRPAAGDCDLAETCDGTSAACPVDARRPAGSVCRAGAGDCDAPETCDGSSVVCPADAKRPAGFVCRAAVGACDAAETCDGLADTCPADAIRPSGFVCRAVANTCDLAETCDGLGVACPADVRMPDDVACTDGNPCTKDDRCHAGSCVGTAVVCQAGVAATVPSDLTGTLALGETKYYAFTASAGWLVYGRAIRAPATQLDPYLVLLDADGHTQLAVNDDESPARTDALLLYRIPADGTYYMGVRDRLNASAGWFTLQLRRWQPETQTGPGTIDLATTPSVLIRADLVGDDTTHTYTLHAPAGYHFAADVVAREASPFPGSAAEVALALRDAEGAVLGTSTDRGYGPDPVIYYESAAAADLTLEVSRDPATDPAGGFYLLNLRPAVVINEVYLESASIPDASFVEVSGPAGLSLAGYSLVAGAYTSDLATCSIPPGSPGPAVLGPTGLAVLGHDALVVGATCIDVALAIPAGGTLELRRGGVAIDTFTYSAAVGALRIGRGFTQDTDRTSDLLVQVEESSDEGNYTNVP
ncbi:MAG: hypothetical protein HY906_04480 [Deltaproteobacteria bacterium]|nr:hypothetical protein [Deltaproteobacteria bacterium]